MQRHRQARSWASSSTVRPIRLVQLGVARAQDAEAAEDPISERHTDDVRDALEEQRSPTPQPPAKDRLLNSR